jgi:hypothetical protein
MSNWNDLFRVNILELTMNSMKMVNKIQIGTFNIYNRNL